MSGDSGFESHCLVPPHGNINITFRDTVELGNGALAQNTCLFDFLVSFSVIKHHVKSYVIGARYLAADN